MVLCLVATTWQSVDSQAFAGIDGRYVEIDSSQKHHSQSQIGLVRHEPLGTKQYMVFGALRLTRKSDHTEDSIG